jgi:hypothetical protein
MPRWRVIFWHFAGPASIVRSGFECAFAPQRVAGEVDAMGVVDEAIENGVGVGGIADHVVPFVDRQLAGDDGRAPAVAFFQDLEKVVAGLRIEGLEAPVVEDQQLDAGQRSQQAWIATSPRASARSSNSLGTR